MHGRALRRVERRIAEGGGAAGDAGLERIAALQARERTSQGGVSRGGSALRVAGVVGGSVLVLALVVGGGYFLFFRDDNGDATAASTGDRTTSTQRRTTSRSSTAPLPPDRRDRVPANP